MSSIFLLLQFIGCYEDHPSEGTGERDMAVEVDPVDTAAMGPARAMLCADACTGYQYFGLQWTNECFCDNNYGDQGEAPLSSCDADETVDPGDIADLCGAGEAGCGWVNAVYRIEYDIGSHHGSTHQPCSNFNEFSAFLPDLNAVCCNDENEHCLAGLPTTCDAECAALLIPMQTACQPFWDANREATVSISSMIGDTVTLCHSSHAGPTGGGGH